MAYTIMISEEQRAALLEVLKAADKKWTGLKPGCHIAASEEAPLEYWIDMLTELPDIDAASEHKTVHGFCL